MVVLGVMLLILGTVLQVGTLSVTGLILLAVGALLWILGSVGHPVGGRRYWY